MNKPPCIRGLNHFKKGCPQRPWDGEEGCPAWIELSVTSRGNPLQREIKKQCLDLWTWEFQWASLGVGEGIQQATESSRNMIALQSLIVTGTRTPEELAQVATKILTQNKKDLMIEAQGGGNDKTQP